MDVPAVVLPPVGLPIRPADVQVPLAPRAQPAQDLAGAPDPVAVQRVRPGPPHRVRPAARVTREGQQRLRLRGHPSSIANIFSSYRTGTERSRPAVGGSGV